jgi:CheY-like chemotaxis protein
MDAVTQVRMFEPFFSTKFAGRGLGLPAVLGIIRAHEGALNVYSEPGRGTRIRVLLPAPGEATPSQRRRSTRADQGVVVVADDEDAVRRVTTAMLEKSGYHVYSARDGREAVELVLQQGNDVKALLLDMAMPEMGGIEALQTLRELDCSVPVILSSGLVDIDALECLSEHDRVRVLQKPFRAADLLGMLHELAT